MRGPGVPPRRTAKSWLVGNSEAELHRWERNSICGPFTDAVLDQGPLPLDVLEGKIDAWIKGRP